MAHRRSLVDADRERTHAGDPLRDLHAEEHAARPRLRALPHRELDRVGHPQVLEVQHVARRGHLVDEGRRGLALVLEHSALPRARHRPSLGGAVPERRLGVGGERPEGHGGDVDGDVEAERLGDETGPVAEDGGRLAALAVPLEGETRHGGGDEHEVVEARHPVAEGVVAPELVAPELGHRVHVRDRLRGPPRRLAAVVGVRRSGDAPGDRSVAHRDRVLRGRIEGILVRHPAGARPVLPFLVRHPILRTQIISHALASRLSKCHSRCSETTLRQSRLESPSRARRGAPRPTRPPPPPAPRGGRPRRGIRPGPRATPPRPRASRRTPRRPRRGR